MIFEAIENPDESSLIEVFSDVSYWDPDSVNKLYRYSPTAGLSTDKLIACFIDEVLEGNFYEDLGAISEANAGILLRQMAMFQMDDNKKVQMCAPSEAKMYARQLLDFLGKKTECYTNVGAVDQPHDNPGQVTLNTHLHTHYDSICLIAVNTDYLLFIEQEWNYGGE